MVWGEFRGVQVLHWPLGSTELSWQGQQQLWQVMQGTVCTPRKLELPPLAVLAAPTTACLCIAQGTGLCSFSVVAGIGAAVGLFHHLASEVK